MMSECFAPARPGGSSAYNSPPSGVVKAIGYYAVEITEEESMRRANCVNEIQALHLDYDCLPIYFYSSSAKEQILILIRNPLNAIERIVLFTQQSDTVGYQQTELVTANTNSVESFINFNPCPIVFLRYEGTDGFSYAKKVDVSNEDITLIDDTSVSTPVGIQGSSENSISGE